MSAQDLALEGLKDLIGMFGPGALERIERGNCPCCDDPLIILSNTPAPHRHVEIQCACGFRFVIHVDVPTPRTSIKH